MTLKISSPSVSAFTTASTKVSGAGAAAPQSIAAGPGGCYQPGPKDQFDPPVLGGPISGGGVSPFYRFELRNMSDSQLQQEKFSQEVNLLVSQLLGDRAGANEARAKLGAISQEERRRECDGGGDDNTVSLTHYKHELHGMSDWQLSREQRKEQGAYWRAKLSGDPEAAELAQKKLQAISHEQMSRMCNPFPPFPFPRPMPFPRPIPVDPLPRPFPGPVLY